MPNWCSNNLVISHDDAAKLNEFKDTYNKGTTCEHYITTPRKENGELIDDWYGWRLKNWGTKWSFGKDQDDPYSQSAEISNNAIGVNFQTAWSPPIGLYQFLHNLGFKIEASYFEPGMCFCGKWVNGKNEYYHFDNPDQIPDDLWDEFNMADFFEEQGYDEPNWRSGV